MHGNENQSPNILIRSRTFTISNRNDRLNISPECLEDINTKLANEIRIFYQRKLCHAIFSEWWRNIRRNDNESKQLPSNVLVQRNSAESKIADGCCKVETFRRSLKSSRDVEDLEIAAFKLYVFRLHRTVLWKWLHWMKMKIRAKNILDNVKNFRKLQALRLCFGIWRKHNMYCKKRIRLEAASNKLYLSIIIEKWRKKWRLQTSIRRNEEKAVAMYQFICVRQAISIWHGQLIEQRQHDLKETLARKNNAMKILHRVFIEWRTRAQELILKRHRFSLSINLYIIKQKRRIFNGWKLLLVESVAARRLPSLALACSLLRTRAWRLWRDVASAARARVACARDARRRRLVTVALAAWRSVRDARACERLRVREARAEAARNCCMRPTFDALRTHAQRRVARARKRQQVAALVSPEIIVLRPYMMAWIDAHTSVVLTKKKEHSTSEHYRRRILSCSFVGFRTWRHSETNKRERKRRLNILAKSIFLGRFIERWQCMQSERFLARLCTASAVQNWSKCLMRQSLRRWAAWAEGERLRRARRGAIRAMLGLPGLRGPRLARPCPPESDCGGGGGGAGCCATEALASDALMLHYNIRVLFEVFRSWRTFTRNSYWSTQKTTRNTTRKDTVLHTSKPEETDEIVRKEIRHDFIHHEKDKFSFVNSIDEYSLSKEGHYLNPRIPPFMESECSRDSSVQKYFLQLDGENMCRY